MCAQPDRHSFSTRLTFLSAGQSEHCLADLPTRFRLMVWLKTLTAEKAKRGQQVLDISTVRFVLCLLGLATSFSFVGFFDISWLGPS